MAQGGSQAADKKLFLDALFVRCEGIYNLYFVSYEALIFLQKFTKFTFVYKKRRVSQVAQRLLKATAIVSTTGKKSVKPFLYNLTQS